MELPSFPPELSQKILKLEQSAQREAIEKAMLLVAPEVAALGFEVYQSRLAADREGGHKMVMLELEHGRPWQPIVYLPLPDVDLNETKAHISFTPVAGEAGWEAFQLLRSRNSMSS